MSFRDDPQYAGVLRGGGAESGGYLIPLHRERPCILGGYTVFFVSSDQKGSKKRTTKKLFFLLTFLLKYAKIRKMEVMFV